MLTGFTALAGTFKADWWRLQARGKSAAVCYAISGFVFAAAASLSGAAGVIALVRGLGLIEGLLAAAGILLVIGIAALAVNAMLRRRYERMQRYASAARSVVVAEAAISGLAQGRSATPALMPVVGILAFALANALLKPSRNDR